MCYSNSMFDAITVMPRPAQTSVERGALLCAKSGDHAGDMYMLAREAEGVYAKDATGKNIGAPKFLFNLYNLTSEGKARVSKPERKLAWNTNSVPVSVLEDHFGFKLDVLAGNIEEIKHVLYTASNQLAAKRAAEQTPQYVQVPMALMSMNRMIPFLPFDWRF